MIRSDGTVKDFDLVAFCEYREVFEDAKQRLKVEEKAHKEKGEPFPNVSIEPTRFANWPKRKSVLQFVSGIEVDENNNPYFTFDKLKQPVSWQSLAPWRIVLTQHNDTSITTFDPFAHALRYCMRVPSGVKKKDRETHTENGERFNKMSLLMRFGMMVEAQARQHGQDYRHDLYKPWFDFIRAMMHDPHLSVSIKRVITKNYWDTVGTAFSHGVGIFKPLADLGDRFAG